MTQSQPTTADVDAIKAQEERKRRAIRSALYHLAQVTAALHEADTFHDLDDVYANSELLRAEKALTDATTFFNRIRG
jgi:hypothetical protein